MQNDNLMVRYLINKGLRQKLEIRKDIFYVQMNITNKCSEMCSHCYLKEKKFESEATATDFIEILTCLNIKAISDSKQLVVDLIGGDPLCKSDLYIILEYLNRADINYGLKGNPYLLKKNIKQLINFGCKRYQMSLDGLEKTHDLLRTPNSYKCTIEAIKILNQYQIPVSIKYTLSDKNYYDLWPLLYELYDEGLRIDSFSVARYHADDGKGFHISSSYYDDALDNLTKFYIMQIKRKDIKIYVNLKEHLWIAYLANKRYLFKEFYELTESYPYVSCCSMMGCDTTFITSDGYYDICPKISGFVKTKVYNQYREAKIKYLNRIIDTSCQLCLWNKICLGCPAFHIDGKDCDCFFRR